MFRDEERVVADDARYVSLHAVADTVVEATGQDYDTASVLRFELQEGRIARVLEYPNPIIRHSLGLSEVPWDVTPSEAPAAASPGAASRA